MVEEKKDVIQLGTQKKTWQTHDTLDIAYKGSFLILPWLVVSVSVDITCTTSVVTVRKDLHQALDVHNLKLLQPSNNHPVFAILTRMELLAFV